MLILFRENFSNMFLTTNKVSLNGYILADMYQYEHDQGCEPPVQFIYLVS